MAVAAVGIFWALGHGRWSTTSVLGFAESVDHPAAPLEAGRVAEIFVHLGQVVHPGDPLARLDTEELLRKQETAKITLQEARAQLSAEEVTQKAAVARAELLVLRLENAQNQNKAELVEAERQVARLEALADQQLVPVGALEQSRLRRAGLSASVATLDNARKQKQAGLGNPLREQVSQEQVERRLAPVREMVRLRELAVETARAAVERATLKATVEGVVSSVLHLPGDVVAAGMEIVRVTSGRPGLVVCWLPEREATRPALGKPVHLRERGLLAKGFDARVVEISPVIEEIPLRAREAPNVPSWGRRVTLESHPPRPLIWGEALNVDF